MGDFKLYGINISAFILTIYNNINENLQSILLVLTIVYTMINIFSKINKK